MNFDALAMHRLAHRLYRLGVPVLPTLIDGLVFILYNSRIHHSTVIGEGSRIGYRGMSVLIHQRARLGSNVNIGAHVVIGGRAGHVDLPVIEDEVELSCNCCVLGDITVGRGAVIGAGAVVIHDVEPGQVVVGVPARPLDGER